jgi:delta 1-pyrroline-5-carboxylate dehydrogenase
VTGDPAELATDVGPVIDREAFDGIQPSAAAEFTRQKPCWPQLP